MLITVNWNRKYTEYIAEQANLSCLNNVFQMSHCLTLWPFKHWFNVFSLFCARDIRPALKKKTRIFQFHSNCLSGEYCD